MNGKTQALLQRQTGDSRPAACLRNNCSEPGGSSPRPAAADKATTWPHRCPLRTQIQKTVRVQFGIERNAERRRCRGLFERRHDQMGHAPESHGRFEGKKVVLCVNVLKLSFSPRRAPRCRLTRNVYSTQQRQHRLHVLLNTCSPTRVASQVFVPQQQSGLGNPFPASVLVGPAPCVAHRVSGNRVLFVLQQSKHMRQHITRQHHWRLHGNAQTPQAFPANAETRNGAAVRCGPVGVVPRQCQGQKQDGEEHLVRRSRCVAALFSAVSLVSVPLTFVAVGVYLGTKQSAAKLEALTFLGISRIVNVGGGPCLFAEVDYWEIHLSDKRDADLLTELDDATQFIHESVLAGTGVLCHCQGACVRC